MTTVRFNTRQHPFFDELKKKVDHYFDEHNLKTWGNWKLYAKTAILLVTGTGLYTWLVFFTPQVELSIALCALLGLNLAAIGFNVMHDGGHGSFSNKHWLNEAMGYTLNLMGGNIHLWKIKHNMIHHSFTNIEGVDDDIDIQPWIRTNKHQPKKWYHRFQYIYWFVLYGLTYLLWIFWMDFSKYFKRQIGNIPIRKFSTKEHIIFWGSKLGYFFLFLALPMMTVGVAATLWGYLIITFVCGLILSVVFQLAHVVDEVHFADPKESNHEMEDEWAVHQIKTTSNFAMQSKFVSWITGGLNYQVEHHLFPRVSHIHYPALSKLVKETCQRFNLPYNEHKTVMLALRSHVSYLKDVGR